jgi:hypothetical protein
MRRELHLIDHLHNCKYIGTGKGVMLPDRIWPFPIPAALCGWRVRSRARFHNHQMEVFNWPDL